MISNGLGFEWLQILDLSCSQIVLVPAVALGAPKLNPALGAAAAAGAPNAGAAAAAVVVFGAPNENPPAPAPPPVDPPKLNDMTPMSFTG